MGEDNQGLDPKIYGRVGPGEMSLYVPLIDDPRRDPSVESPRPSIRQLRNDMVSLKSRSRTIQVMQWGED